MTAKNNRLIAKYLKSIGEECLWEFGGKIVDESSRTYTTGRDEVVVRGGPPSVYFRCVNTGIWAFLPPELTKLCYDIR